MISSIFLVISQVVHACPAPNKDRTLQTWTRDLKLAPKPKQGLNQVPEPYLVQTLSPKEDWTNDLNQWNESLLQASNEDWSKDLI